MSSSSAQIDFFRLSFIWTETNTDLLRNPGPPNAPMGFLGSRDGYMAKFDEIQKGSAPLGLTTPWRDDPVGQRFWKFYLSTSDLTTTSGASAWAHLVPLRGAVLATINPPQPELSFASHAFYYPFGFALVVTVTCKASLSLQETIQQAFQIRSEGKIKVQTAAGTEDLYLTQYANKCLNALRGAVFPPATPAGKISSEPFSIFTAVKGSGVAAGADIPEGGEIHGILDAVTTWDTDYPDINLTPLNVAKVGLREKSPPGHILYANKRGRAVWFPGKFTRQAVKRPSVTCYHKNLVFVSLQVESLCGFLRATAEVIRSGDGPSLPKWHFELSKEAANVVGRLYGYDEEMYRSRSPRVQLDQNRYTEDVNVVRTFHGRDELV